MELHFGGSLPGGMGATAAGARQLEELGFEYAATAESRWLMNFEPLSLSRPTKGTGRRARTRWIAPPTRSAAFVEVMAEHRRAKSP